MEWKTLFDRGLLALAYRHTGHYEVDRTKLSLHAKATRRWLPMERFPSSITTTTITN